MSLHPCPGTLSGVLRMCFVVVCAAVDSSRLLAQGFASAGCQAYPSGGPHGPCVLADLNGDGLPDAALLTGGASSGAIAVFLNEGGGRLGSRTEHAPGGIPEGMAAGDFDSSGTMDLAISDPGAGTVTMLLGRGDGTFTAREGINLGGGPLSIVAADLDTDGKMDLAVVCRDSGLVTLLVGGGDGSFEWRSATRVGRFPSALGVGRVDADSIPDLVTCDSLDGTLSVLVGLGDGTFRLAGTVPVGVDPCSLELADLNLDGLDDILVAERSPDLARVLRNESGNSFSLQGTLPVAGATEANWIDVADLNADGNLDSLVACPAAGKLVLFPGAGGFRFGSGETIRSGGGPVWVGAVDLRRSGRLDIVLADAADESLHVCLSDPGARPVVIDDVDSGASRTGVWSASSAPVPYGGGSLYAKSSSATFSWSASLPEPGAYRVLVWWTRTAGRVTAAPYAVVHAGGETTVHVDQTNGGGEWSLLGTYRFDGAGKVVLRSTSGTASTCADAVRFELVSTGNIPPVAHIGSVSPSPAPLERPVFFQGSGQDQDGSVMGYQWKSSMDGLIGASASFSTSSLSEGSHTIFFQVEDDGGLRSAETSTLLEVRALPSGPLILDDGEPGTSSTGAWSVSLAPSPYGPRSLYGRSGSTYTYSLDLGAPGRYEVQLWWTELTTRSSSAPVDIVEPDGTRTVLVDQRKNGGKWNPLGDFLFGVTAVVTIHAGATGSTCADAVRIVPANLPPTARIDSIVPSPAGERQLVSFAGSGQDADGRIACHSWVSSIDGQLSTLPAFATVALTPGTHSISFRVRDDAGVWSAAVDSALEVRGSGPGPALVLDDGDAGTSPHGSWSVSGAPRPFGARSLYARDGAAYEYGFPLAGPGLYAVYACWTEWPSRSAVVPIDILGAITGVGGVVRRTVSQQVIGGDFSIERDALSVASIRSLGAVGDGATDDAPAIRAAIAALPPGGETIFFPAGTYVVGSPIAVSRPVRLVGEGKASILQARGDPGAVLAFRGGADGSSAGSLAIHGSKSGAGGTVQVGVSIAGAGGCTVRQVTFSGPAPGTGLNFGLLVEGQESGGTRVLFCRFERLVSSSSNGTAIEIADSKGNQIFGCEVDGTELHRADGGAGAAIMFAPALGGGSASGNYVGHCLILNHPQVGIAFNSTTYAEFPGNLAGADGNVIEYNEITGCRSPRGGEASSAITLVGSSSQNVIRFNHIHGNGDPAAGGYGIVLSGTRGLARRITGSADTEPILVTATGHGFATGERVGISGVLGNTSANGAWTVTVLDADRFTLDGSRGNGAYGGGGLAGRAGTAKIDEYGRKNEIAGNTVEGNQDHGIRVNGCVETAIRGNTCRDNGRRAANAFVNIHVVRVAESGPTGDGNVIELNDCSGSGLRHQIEVGAGPRGTVIANNIVEAGAMGAILDAGTDTVLVTGSSADLRSWIAKPRQGSAALLIGAGQWSYLGTHSFAGPATIRINAVGDGTTCADAMCLVPAGEQ